MKLILISAVNGARVSAGSSGRGMVESAENPQGWEYVRPRVAVSARRPGRFSPGSVERACVRTVHNCHSPHSSLRVPSRYFRIVSREKVITGGEKFVRLAGMSFCSQMYFFRRLGERE